MLLPVSSNFFVEFVYPSGLKPGLHNFVNRLKVETDTDGRTIIQENKATVPQLPPPPPPSFEQQTTTSLEYIASHNASQEDKIEQLEREISNLRGEIRDLHSGYSGNTWSSSSWENSIPGLKEDIRDLYDEINKLSRDISDLRYELQRK